MDLICGCRRGGVQPSPECHGYSLCRMRATAPAIDPALEPPSLEALLGSTEFADAVAEARAEVDPEVWPEFIDRVRDDLRRLW